MKTPIPSLSNGMGKVTANLPRIQRAVYNFLLRGKGRRYSVADISTALHLSDPRSHIRELRNKGILIEDEWKKTEYGTRYKVFYISNHL